MVGLVELEEAQFREYRESTVRDYAQDKVEAGVWSEEEATRKSEREIDSLLPDGLATKGHFLYAVEDRSLPATIGMVWFALPGSSVGRAVWIYDIVVHERFRRKGYGTRVRDIVEERVRELGAEKVELHVFGHNRAARRLYEKVGFGATSVVMSKDLRRP